MGRKTAEAAILVHIPETEEKRRDLSLKAACVHAEAAVRAIQKLDCPPGQKLEILDAIIKKAEGK